MVHQQQPDAEQSYCCLSLAVIGWLSVLFAVIGRFVFAQDRTYTRGSQTAAGCRAVVLLSD